MILDISRNTKLGMVGIILFIIISIAIYFIFLSAPTLFLDNYLLHIDEGLTLSGVGNILHDEGIIKYPFIYKGLTILFTGGQKAVAGDYYFENNTNIISVSYRIARGKYGIDPIKVTFPEGFSSKDMATLLSKKIESFDSDTFEKKARNKEGYLFPDTYLFLPNVGQEEIISTMTENFDNKIEEISEDISKSKYSLHELVIMASILEKEAIEVEDMKIIAGILWKRIESNFPLQVDAPFVYFLNKNTFQLTLDDLKIKNTYNTYLNTGLPEGPISNPGLESLLASIYYNESPYWYYLSDLNSTIYYSKTFDEHVQKKEKYLNIEQ